MSESELPPLRVRVRRIVSLSLPIIGGMTSQLVMMIADTIMVGQLDESALAIAALGFGGFASGVIADFVIGIGAGVQTIAARRMGEGRARESGFALTEALKISIVFGLPLALLGALIAPGMAALLTDDPHILREATPFLALRNFNWVFIMLTFSFRGFFNGISQPRIYLMVIFLMQILNVLAGYVFIFGWGPAPSLGVTGAGIGSLIATALGALIYVLVARYYGATHGALQSAPPGPARRELRAALLKLSLPAALAGFAASSGFVVFLKLTGLVGVAETAATVILINVAFTFLFPSIGFGLAAATLVSENLGAGRAKAAFRAGRETMWVGALSLASLGFLLFVFARPIIATFTDDPEAASLALLPLQIFSVGLFLDVAGVIYSQALIGAGAVRSVMFGHLVGMYGVFLPGAWFFGVYLGYGMLGLWLPMFAYRVLLTGFFAALFERRKWAAIQV